MRTIITTSLYSIILLLPVHMAAKDIKVSIEKFFSEPKTGTVLKIGEVEFVGIKGNAFLMGDSENEGWDDEKPVHMVKLDSFMIGKFEITQKQYKEIMGENPSQYKGPYNPVNRVTWNDAGKFCKKFKDKYFKNIPGIEVRLPTEAEWEYACRGNTKENRYWKDDDVNNYAWYKANSGNTVHPVGKKKPNKFGLYDMNGNVWEWCMDWYGEKYYKKSPVLNPRGEKRGTGKVMRGGAWNSEQKVILRSTTRHSYDPMIQYASYGFRVVITHRKE